MLLNMFFSNKGFAMILVFILSNSFIFGANWAEVIDNSGPAIGRIQVKDSRGALISQGTGFVTKDSEDNQIFITNAHVIKDAWHNDSLTLSISFDYGRRSGDEETREYGGVIERYNSNLDLGLISLDGTVQATLELDKDNSSGLMTEIVVAGYPLGKSFKATPGMVQAYQEIEKLGEMIDMSAVLAPGNSGGPVLNETGHVIGVATAVIQGYNFNFAIPTKNLIRFIDAANNTVILDVNSTPEDSRVFINGDYKGVTPLELDLFNNQYTLRVEHDGYETKVENIGPWDSLTGNILDMNLTAIEVFEPTIYITTDPEGAEIFIGNTKIGVSPLSVEMPPGRILRVRAKKAPFKKGSINYRISEESEQTVHITLD